MGGLGFMFIFVCNVEKELYYNVVVFCCLGQQFYFQFYSNNYYLGVDIL